MTELAINKPIFVIGTPRSGTTLTAKILGQHSNIFMPGETHFFDDIFYRREGSAEVLGGQELDDTLSRLFTLYHRYYEPADQERVEKIYKDETKFKEAFSGCHTYSGMLSKFMSEQMQHEGGRRWGNNAPRDLFAVDDILQFYPDAKFIVCVRDIRAFLYSYQGKWKVTGEDHIERLKALYHPVVTSFLWKSSIRELERIKKVVSAENIVVVKYEDLVTDSDKTVRCICNVIEEEFENGMLDISTHNSSNVTGEDGIFSNSIDRWTEHLSGAEITVAQIIGKRELNSLGYRTTHANGNWFTVVRYFLETPFALWRAVAANREVTGPVLPYLFKRVRNLIGL